ncbi:MAG: hydantoinase/carbamoylase family amidase [bacterium]|nr:hydantoinase/carbamoylase family amidase [bacterium]
MKLTDPNDSNITISPESIKSRYNFLDYIGNIGAGPEAGYLRAAYSDDETRGMKVLAEAAADAGLNCTWDGLGNLSIETPGNFREWIETGSHLDTVPCGGNFDGLAGVVAGLEALIALQASSGRVKRGMRLRVWRGEESATFGSSSTGSKGAFGILEPAVLLNRFQGISLKDAMLSQGCDPSVVENRVATIPPEGIDSIYAYIELHIEQGNLLETSGKELGIVLGIRGASRMMVTLEGAFDHSGATPMGGAFRKDVNLALGYIIVRLDELATRHIEAGMDLVQTIGVINSSSDLNELNSDIYRNAVTKVSGFAYFSHEVRSCNSYESDIFCLEAIEIILDTAKEFGISAGIKEIGKTAGIPSLSGTVQVALEASSCEAGASFMKMFSGAWHDAAVVASQQRSDGSRIPAGMLFIPCKDGKSHTPEEYCSPEQIAKGATVLARAMLRLADE